MASLAFAPLLYIPHGSTDLGFFERALGAEESYRLTNEDGSIHVAEFKLGEMIFHVHEENREKGQYVQAALPGRAVLIGLFVDDVHAMMERALAAGAILVAPVQDFDYGYRQGEFLDPFGHQWVLQCRIPTERHEP